MLRASQKNETFSNHMTKAGAAFEGPHFSNMNLIINPEPVPGNGQALAWICGILGVQNPLKPCVASCRTSLNHINEHQSRVHAEATWVRSEALGLAAATALTA